MQVDRVYVSSPNVIAVLDHEKKRTFVIRKDCLPDNGKTPPHIISSVSIRPAMVVYDGNAVCISPP